MKILITGAAGFIGSNLSEYLLNKGHTIIAIDNFNNFYDPKVKEYNIKDFIHNPRFILHRIDISEDALLQNTLNDYNDIGAIIHLAAWAGVTRSFEEASTYIRNNIEGTANLLNFAVNKNIRNFLFASTSSVYGDGATPFKEEMNTDMPLSPYPATKKSCEVLLYSYSKNYDINVTVMRIFNPVGPRLRPDLLLPKLIKSCLYDVECPIFWKQEDLYNKTGRDYTYINHMFEFMEFVIENPFKYEVFNLGNSSPVMLGDVIDIVEEVVKKKPKVSIKDYRKGEMLVTYADITKAKNMTNYNPVTSIKESIRDYYNWFVSQEEWYKTL